MLDHLMFHVADLKKSHKFYEAALKPLGMKAKVSGENVMFKDQRMLFAIREGSASQHVHLAFKARSEKEVDEFFKAAIENGGIDNGRPGPRDYGPGYYAAFVIDPDGNNIEAAHHGH